MEVGAHRADVGGMTVGAVAAAVGVTVRTLHHWDAVGLVRPSARSPRGYRRYDAGDLARVQRVLVHRALGLSLDAIRELLDDAGVDQMAALRRQREQVAARIAELTAMQTGIERMIQARENGILLTAEQQAEIFGPRWRPEWVAKAAQQWGDTQQWAQYAERAAQRDAEDWKRIGDAATALDEDLAAAVRSGVRPDSPEALVLAERHRATIGAHFDCTHGMQVCLGRMYEEDANFTRHYDSIAPGLTRWLRAAIEANARAHGVDPDTATWA